MPGTEIPTDLLTPLGAYLRCARGRARRVPARVGRARTARPLQLRRRRARGSSSFAEAETLGEPVVGYLGYDAVASFEPTVPLPEDGPDVPESLFLVPDVLLRFDHARGVAELLRGEATRLAGARRPMPARHRRRVARSSASRRATSTSAASSARRSTSARATSSRS